MDLAMAWRGRRIVKAVRNSGDLDGTYHYFYDGDCMIETRKGSGIVVKQHVWGAPYAMSWWTSSATWRGLGRRFGREKNFVPFNSAKSAQKWVERNPGEYAQGYRIIAVDVPADVTATARHAANLDQIGDAVFLAIDDLLGAAIKEAIKW